MTDFPKTVEALLVAEHGRTEAEAEAAALVKRHTDIVIRGIMGGLTFASVRATAMAIMMRESEPAADEPTVIRP